jgi:predicted GNAT family N-acyltransferase
MSKNLVVFKNYDEERIDNNFSYNKKDEPLVNFFNNQAKELIENKISTIKTIYLNGKFVGFYSVSMSSIESDKLFDEKRAATYAHPAIIIGRILLDKNYRKMGIGGKIIVSIIQIAKLLNKFCACRFIIVDSKKNVEKFYEKTGFVAIPKEKQQSKRTTKMLFDLKD